ncbi:MAG: 30S ribosomal protein S6 [Myxococcota bacterium]
MREYETTLIIQPEISDDGVGEIKDRLDRFLSEAGAIRLLYEDLGRRRMAYEIRNFLKGRYVMLQFLDEGSVITGLERAIRLEESIIRFLTVQVSDEVPDIAARVAAAAEEERIRAEKAAARAAREAEDAARQEAEAAEAARAAELRAEAAAAAAATAAAAEDAADAGAEDTGAEGAADAGAEDAGDEEVADGSEDGERKEADDTESASAPEQAGEPETDSSQEAES